MHDQFRDLSPNPFWTVGISPKRTLLSQILIGFVFILSGYL